MRLEAVADRRLHPATFLIRAIRSLPQYALAMPAALGVVADVGWGVVLLASFGGIGVALIAGYLFWTRFRYGLGAREIVIESGLLHRQRRVIPFDRIQDIDIEQGLLARLFGTAKVRIETGGGGKDEGDLDLVALVDAQRLRERLRRGAAGAEAEIEAGPAEEPVLFRMSVRRVLLAGLFNFSLFYLAFIFGGLEYVEVLFGIDVLSLDWVGPARDLAGQATWGLSVAAAALVILIGSIAGILRTLARDFGFTLTRSEAGLRRRRGLFTLSEVVIPTRRVQLALIKSGFIARRFGWHSLAFQTLSADAGKAGHQVAAPFATMDEALRVLAEVRPAQLPPREDFIRVSKRHILRQALRWSLALALPLLVWTILYRWAAFGLLAVPALAGAAALQWRHHRYCLAPDALYVRQGLFGRRLWILPYERIQTITISSGPLQRRLGLASLWPDTAGASLLSGPGIVNLAAPDADRLAERLMATHKTARAALRHSA